MLSEDLRIIKSEDLQIHYIYCWWLLEIIRLTATSTSRLRRGTGSRKSASCIYIQSHLHQHQILLQLNPILSACLYISPFYVLANGVFIFNK